MYSQICLTDQSKVKILSKAFSRQPILDLVREGSSSLLKRIIKEAGVVVSEKTQLSALYEFFYEQLLLSYKNEYVYKNIVAKKIIQEKHNFKKVTYINEFKVQSSIVDIAIFNGTSTAYEIKTELDNLDRLKSQLPSYRSIFEHIYLVVDEKKISVLKETLPSYIGICTLSCDNEIHEYRKAESNLENISKESIFNSLRFSELLSFAENEVGYIPTGRIQQQKNDCFDIFMQFSIEEIHQIFIEIMHGRSFKKYECDLFPQIPTALLALLLNLRLSQPQLNKLNNLLAYNLK